MGFYEGAKINLQRARRELRLPLGALVTYSCWEPVGADELFANEAKIIKVLCMVVGIWRWNALGMREGELREKIFGIAPGAENCNASGYLLLPSGRTGWHYALFGDLGDTLLAA